MDRLEQLNKVKDVVANVLIDNPETRGDDDLLYIEVCRKYSDIAVRLPFEEIWRCRKQYGLPNYESVGRARRKLQEEFLHLRPSVSCLMAKKAEEKAYRAFARGL